MLGLLLFTLLSSMVTTPTPFSVSEPVVTPRKARVSDTVIIEGSEGDIGGGSTTILYLDTVKAWDGSSGALNATISLSSGYYKMSFEVPEVPGGLHRLIVKDSESLVYVSTTFTVVTIAMRGAGSGTTAGHSSGTGDNAPGRLAET